VLKHIVGETSNNNKIIAQTTDQHQPIQNEVGHDTHQTLRIGSTFDYDEEVFKVVSTCHLGGIMAKCIWGNKKGAEVHFDNAREVIELVNRKRGH